MILPQVILFKCKLLYTFPRTEQHVYIQTDGWTGKDVLK